MGRKCGCGGYSDISFGEAHLVSSFFSAVLRTGISSPISIRFGAMTSPSGFYEWKPMGRIQIFGQIPERLLLFARVFVPGWSEYQTCLDPRMIRGSLLDVQYCPCLLLSHLTIP